MLCTIMNLYIVTVMDLYIATVMISVMDLCIASDMDLYYELFSKALIPTKLRTYIYNTNSL